MSIEFHFPKFHKNNLYSKEGGTIDFENRLKGNLNELFSHVEPVLSGFAQYRKVFIKNSGLVSLTGIRAWIDSEEYQNQFSLGSGITKDQHIGSALGAPTGIYFTGGYVNYTGSKFFINDLGPNHHTGFWIRQIFTGSFASGADPYAEARLYVGWKE